MVKSINVEDGLTSNEVSSIVDSTFVQKLIKDKISKNEYVKKEDIENGIKDAILKSWNDKSITNIAVNKVKNDIK
jgi:hypothetical protein